MRGAILPLYLLQTVLLAVANSQPAVLSDFAAARQRMVEEQLSAPGRDIKNRLVLEAMATVPRHEFVPESLRKFAYWDEADVIMDGGSSAKAQSPSATVTDTMKTRCLFLRLLKTFSQNQELGCECATPSR